jgi:soluble lytic murein transglycosylase
MNSGQKNLAYQKFLNGFNNVPYEDLSAGLGYYAGLMAGELGQAEQKKILWEKVLSDHDHNYYAYVIADRLKIPNVSYGKTEKQTSDLRLIKVSPLYDFFYKYQQYDDAAFELKAQMRSFPAADRVKLNLHLAHILFKAQKYNQSIEIASAVLLPALYKKSQAPVSAEFWKYAYPLGYQETVFHYANLYGVDPYFALAVIREESRFNPNVVSWARAHGLMQVIPPTGEALAKKLGIPHFNEQMLLDPEISIRLGVYYLKTLFDAHPDNPILVLAHYNAGPVAVNRWMRDKGNKDWIEFIESITYRETRFYVKKVLSSYWEYRRIYTNSTGITLPK